MCGGVLALALGGCGQKGPLFLPERAGAAARPVARLPSAAEDGRPAAVQPPGNSASSPGLPPAARQP